MKILIGEELIEVTFKDIQRNFQISYPEENVSKREINGRQMGQGRENMEGEEECLIRSLTASYRYNCDLRFGVIIIENNSTSVQSVSVRWHPSVRSVEGCTSPC